MKHIIFTVTNDLSYDQRMIRICNSLAGNGYRVTLVGISKKTSPKLAKKLFAQKRLPMFFKKGPGFYAEYNIKLFFYLLFKKCDGICAIDLDTILPVYFNSRLKGKKRIYDAHEYFSQMKEVVTRPGIYRTWRRIEKKYLPKFKNGYTVSGSIAAEFKSLYGVDYAVIRNLPLYKNYSDTVPAGKTIIYRGAVNEARGFEWLIPAMKDVNAQLRICGDGNFLAQAKALSVKYGLQEKITFTGMLLSEDLEKKTAEAYIGLNPVENTGLSLYYSLANKFFDYMQHGIPQVTMNFPEYRAINEKAPVALLLDDLQPADIAAAINRLLADDKLYAALRANCFKGAGEYNWQNEEHKLLDFYKNIFG